MASPGFSVPPTDKWVAIGHLLLFCLFAVARPGEVAWPCPGQCQCFGNMTVFCYREGLSGIAEGIPPSTTRLFFVETHLFSVQSRAFAHANSRHLAKLAFLDCPLQSLGEAAFEGLPELKELDISTSLLSNLSAEALLGLATLSTLSVKFSPIEALETGLFSNTPHLEALHLQGNEIQSLPPDIFHPLARLKTLTLSQNRLAELPGDVFGPLKSLQVLKLSDNNLTHLTPGLFLPLRGLQELFLEGNALAALPQGAFAQLSALRRLHLQHNALEHLPPSALSAQHHLTFLDLDGNRLTELPDQLFQGTPKLYQLSMANNQLQTIPERVLGNLVNLTILVLSHNNLSHLPVGVFRGLPALAKLQLSHNNLTTLPRDVFANLTHLEVLDIAHNQLVTLPEGIFNSNSFLFHVGLQNNPWACDCHLAHLADWLHHTDTLLNAQTLCRSPAYLKGLSLPSVQKDQLVCLRGSGSSRCRAEGLEPSEEELETPVQCTYRDPAGSILLECDSGVCQQLSLSLPQSESLHGHSGQRFNKDWTLSSACGTLRLWVSVQIQAEQPLPRKNDVSAVTGPPGHHEAP